MKKKEIERSTKDFVKEFKKKYPNLKLIDEKDFTPQIKEMIKMLECEPVQKIERLNNEN